MSFCFWNKHDNLIQLWHANVGYVCCWVSCWICAWALSCTGLPLYAWFVFVFMTVCPFLWVYFRNIIIVQSLLLLCCLQLLWKGLIHEHCFFCEGHVQYLMTTVWLGRFVTILLDSSAVEGLLIVCPKECFFIWKRFLKLHCLWTLAGTGLALHTRWRPGGKTLQYDTVTQTLNIDGNFIDPTMGTFTRSSRNQSEGFGGIVGLFMTLNHHAASALNPACDQELELSGYF